MLNPSSPVGALRSELDPRSSKRVAAGLPQARVLVREKVSNVVCPSGESSSNETLALRNVPVAIIRRSQVGARRILEPPTLRVPLAAVRSAFAVIDQ